MNRKLIYIVLLLVAGSSADAAQSLKSTNVTGEVLQTVLDDGDCNAELDLQGMNVEQAHADCDQDAIAKCGGGAIRVGDFQTTSHCFRSSEWMGTYLSVHFSASYDCKY